MQRLIMDMPLVISVGIRHAADHHGKTEVVAPALEDEIDRCDQLLFGPWVKHMGWRQPTAAIDLGRSGCRGVVSRIEFLSRLNGWPAHTSVNVSP